MPETALLASRGRDGLARIGLTRFQRLGIRLAEGDQGAAPAATPSVEPDPGEAALAAAIQAADAPAPQTVDSLPDWAQKIIHESRGDAASARTSAKTAADTARQALIDDLSAALGLKPDLNPEVLAESLKTSQAEASQKARELAIYKAATSAGANVERLMDSRAVMDALSQIDPTDSAALTAAVTSATAENPYFRAVQAAASSGTPLAGSHEDGQFTEEQLAAIANDPEAIVAAQRAGKLNRLLGAS